MNEMIYCRACGTQLHISATACPKCGAVQKPSNTVGDIKECKILPALLLCLFLGYFGGHRFYVGKSGTAFLLFFLNLFVIGWVWWLIDLIFIIGGSFKDMNGNTLSKWT